MMKPSAAAATLATLATLAAVASPAFADDAQPSSAPGMTAPMPLTAPASPADTTDVKSENTALALSIGGSLLGPAMVVSAIELDGPAPAKEVLGLVGIATIMVGPSAGSFYAHKPRYRGLAVRSVGAGLTLMGVASIAQDLFSQDPNPGGVALLFGGLAVVGVGTVLDWHDARGAARAYNREHAVQWTVTPVISRTPGNEQTGLAIAGRF